MPPEETPTRRGYPLGILFILVALFAVMLGTIAGAWRAHGFQGGHGGSAMVALAVVAFGMLIGLYHHRRIVGLLLGLGSGLVVGAFAGLLTMARVEAGFYVSVMSLVGTALLLVLGAVFYVVNRP